MNISRNLLQPLIRNIVQRRNFEPSTVVSGPPTVHVSSAEKFIFGLLMCSLWCGPPLFVLTQIKHIRNLTDPPPE